MCRLLTILYLIDQTMSYSQQELLSTLRGSSVVIQIRFLRLFLKFYLQKSNSSVLMNSDEHCDMLHAKSRY
jgi:hypothetical protein